MKLAVLFDHFGPYHLARLRGVAKHADVLGIEIRGRSRDYAWEVGKRGDVPLTTLDAGDRETPGVLDAKLASVLGDFAPDAVAIPGWSSPWALRALRWCLGRRIPAVLMTESSRHDERRQAWKEWVKRRLGGMFSTALAGGSLHADYLEALGMPRSRVFLGYDAIDNEFFRKRVAVLRETQTERPQPRHFLASARFIEKKNLFRLLQGFADYRHSVLRLGLEPWSLVLLGDGELRPDIEASVKELQLAEVVTMPGFKQYDELPGYYARASAFIHASTTEQWGLVVNEAMASSLPVLVSDRCGCAPDLVRPELNGFVFDPFNVNAIRSVMERVTRLPEEQRAGMGQASGQIIANWGPERFGEGLSQAARLASSGTFKPTSWLDAMLLAFLARS